MRLVLLLLLLLAAPAGALTIQIDSVSLGASNTADSANNISAAQVLTASDSVPDLTGGPFAEVDARWSGGVFADDASASATANWQIADGHHLSLSTRVIFAPVPEPGTFALIALGLVGLAARRRTRCR